MRVLTYITMMLVLALSSCSTYRKEFDTNPPYASHYFRSNDVEVAWQTDRTEGGIRLAGTVTNRRYAYLRDLELTVRLASEKGTVAARETFADFPTYIPSGQAAPFKLVLRQPEGTIPARLHFNYTFWLAEEPPAVRSYGGYDDTPHFGRFDAPL